MSTSDLAIIVTSRSNKEQLIRCLEYVYTQDFPGTKEIVIVDNGSVDNSVFMVTSRYPQVKVVQNETNVGIGAALNQGLRATKAPYVATLHQDVELGDFWLEHMVNVLASDENVGAACSLVTYRKSRGSRSQVDSAGIAFKEGFPIRIGQGADDNAPRFAEVKRVFGAPGSAAMYKREMLEKIAVNEEVFDETLFALYEDFDIALRAHIHGYRTMYTPSTTTLHKRGILREKNSEAQLEREILSTVNNALVLTKCMPAGIYNKHKKKIKKALRTNIYWLFRRFGASAVLRAWNHYRSSRVTMIRKQRMLFEGIELNVDRLEREVFG